MKKVMPQNLKGFRDFLPKEMAVKNRLIAIVKSVFESFGFAPLETPALEYAETLLGKYGEEADRLVYKFKDRGDRDVALRYDLTVPLARVVAQYPDLPKPFKRYQIQQVWRAEKPQKGRYREFTQCDIDIVGSASPLADAEVIAALYAVFTKIGFKKFVININSRQSLFSAMEDAGVPERDAHSAIRSLDKLDKTSEKDVRAELRAKGFENTRIETIFRAVKRAEPDWFLREVLSSVKKLGVREEYFAFAPTLARGLDYYTGPIYEVVGDKPKLGSLGGGGRYDKLIGMFSGKDIPACGASIGLDRLADAVIENKLWEAMTPSASKVLIASPDEPLLDKALEIAAALRGKDINAEVYLDFGARLEKQLSYADKKGVPFAVILGSEEVRKGKAVLKNLAKRTQRIVPLNMIARTIKKTLQKG